MRRLVFKKWVEILLQFITIIAMFFLVAECENTIAFVISKIIACTIIIINYNLLKKYGRLEEGEL